jgi:hypothetical protein
MAFLHHFGKFGIVNRTGLLATPRIIPSHDFFPFESMDNGLRLIAAQILVRRRGIYKTPSARFAVLLPPFADMGQWDGGHREPCMGALGALGPMESDGGQ